MKRRLITMTVAVAMLATFGAGAANASGEGADERGRSAEAPPECPPASPNAGGAQPCGLLPDGVPPECPPASPNAGGAQPCGHGPDGPGNGENGNGENGNGIECLDEEAVLDLELDLSPLAYACVFLFPSEGAEPACPEGALPIGTIDASPLVTLCATLGPDA